MRGNLNITQPSSLSWGPFTITTFPTFQTFAPSHFQTVSLRGGRRPTRQSHPFHSCKGDESTSTFEIRKSFQTFAHSNFQTSPQSKPQNKRSPASRELHSGPSAATETSGRRGHFKEKKHYHINHNQRSNRSLTISAMQKQKGHRRHTLTSRLWRTFRDIEGNGTLSIDYERTPALCINNTQRHTVVSG